MSLLSGCVVLCILVCTAAMVVVWVNGCESRVSVEEGAGAGSAELLGAGLGVVT